MSKMTIEERLQYVADGRGNFDLAPLVCEHALECIRDLKVIVNCAKTMRKSIKQKRRNSSVKRFDEALENLGGGAREAIGTPAIDAAVKALVEAKLYIEHFGPRGQTDYRRRTDAMLAQIDATLVANGVKA